jgi:hypothetical protein
MHGDSKRVAGDISLNWAACGRILCLGLMLLGRAAPGSAAEASEPIEALNRLSPKVTPMALVFDAAPPLLTIRVAGEWRVGERRSDLAETRVDPRLLDPDAIELMRIPVALPWSGPALDRFLKIACQRRKRCVEFAPVDRPGGAMIGTPDRYDSLVIDVAGEARFEDLDAFVNALQRWLVPLVR